MPEDNTLIHQIVRTPLVFDGAMGTMIYERGVFIHARYDELCLTRPELILTIHQEYVEAGTDVIESNTFGTNRLKLAPFGLANKVEAINRAGVGLPVVVMPNAGGPRELGGRMLYLNSPEYFTEYAKRYVEMGARGVDGCGGTTPQHIRMAARASDSPVAGRPSRGLPGVRAVRTGRGGGRRPGELRRGRLHAEGAKTAELKRKQKQKKQQKKNERGITQITELHRLKRRSCYLCNSEASSFLHVLRALRVKPFSVNPSKATRTGRSR